MFSPKCGRTKLLLSAPSPNAVRASGSARTRISRGTEPATPLVRHRAQDTHCTDLAAACVRCQCARVRECFRRPLHPPQKAQNAQNAKRATRSARRPSSARGPSPCLFAPKSTRPSVLTGGAARPGRWGLKITYFWTRTDRFHATFACCPSVRVLFVLCAVRPPVLPACAVCCPPFCPKTTRLGEHADALRRRRSQPCETARHAFPRFAAWSLQRARSPKRATRRGPRSAGRDRKTAAPFLAVCGVFGRFWPLFGHPRKTSRRHERPWDNIDPKISTRAHGLRSVLFKAPLRIFSGRGHAGPFRWRPSETRNAKNDPKNTQKRTERALRKTPRPAFFESDRTVPREWRRLSAVRSLGRAARCASVVVLG